jgi:hypothetical protein
MTPAEGNCFTGPVRSIRLETVITASISDCFELSLSVDAHTASMSRSGERRPEGSLAGP